MTPMEFSEIIEKLENQWRGAYSEVRKTVLFRIVKDCDARAFNYAAENWIAESKSAPLGDSFREFARKFHQGNSRKHKTYGERPDCVDCSDKGWLTLVMKRELQHLAESNELAIHCMAICFCHSGAAVKAKLESSPENRECAKVVFTPSHRYWYNIENQWEQPTFKGLTWEQYKQQRDNAATVIDLAKRIGQKDNVG